MSNIQKTLDSLQPYVIGIRYLEGMPLVDVVFKEGWTVPEEPSIKKVKGDEGMNYHMIFSETEGVGLDELLGYVDKVIKLNLEREKKHELLRTKVNELKEVFKKHTLSTLQNLKFTFDNDEFATELGDVDEISPLPSFKHTPPAPNIEEDEIEEEEIEEEIEIEETSQPVTYLDENKKPIELTEEDKEILEEEARAERNRKILNKKKKETNRNPIKKKIELPPKRKIQTAISGDDNLDTDCECGPSEACNKCMDSKGY